VSHCKEPCPDHLCLEATKAGMCGYRAPEIKRRTWAEYTWPDWVPAELREQIEGFWSDSWGRGPDAWLAAANDPYNYRDGVEFGERVTLRGVCGEWGKDEVTGRYVYAWNNIGRIVTDDGRVECVANGRNETRAIAKFKERGK
jgi:hypothetical protein